MRPGFRHGWGYGRGKKDPVVVDSTPSIDQTDVADGQVGVSYSTQLSATGGNGVLTWSVSVGTLPDGLTLSSAGLLSGTPTTEETANFTVQVADEDLDVDTLAISMNIAAASAVTRTLVRGPMGLNVRRAA